MCRWTWEVPYSTVTRRLVATGNETSVRRIRVARTASVQALGIALPAFVKKNMQGKDVKEVREILLSFIVEKIFKKNVHFLLKV